MVPPIGRMNSGGGWEAEEFPPVGLLSGPTLGDLLQALLRQRGWPKHQDGVDGRDHPVWSPWRCKRWRGSKAGQAWFLDRIDIGILLRVVCGCLSHELELRGAKFQCPRVLRLHLFGRIMAGGYSPPMHDATTVTKAFCNSRCAPHELHPLCLQLVSILEAQPPILRH